MAEASATPEEQIASVTFSADSGLLEPVLEFVGRMIQRLGLVDTGHLENAAVTTFKILVDRVVTEYGVAELRGSSIRERTRKLIGIAHPKSRDDLTRQAREMGYI